MVYRNTLAVIAALLIAAPVGGDMLINPFGTFGDGGGGETDWTADSTMMALYLFEGAATHAGMGVDSIPDATPRGGNDAISGTVADPPAADTTNYKEGVQSAYVSSSLTDDVLTMNMSEASSGFPTNGTGDGEITVALWFRKETNPASSGYIVRAQQSGSSGFYGRINSSGLLDCRFFGSSSSLLVADDALAADTWYFIAFVYSDSLDISAIYQRAAGSGSPGTWKTLAQASNGTLNDKSSGTFHIGGDDDDATASSITGSIDAMAIFNGKAMTLAELDGVFDNGWDGTGWDN